jgi:hypothetical protein
MTEKRVSLNEKKTFKTLSGRDAFKSHNLRWVNDIECIFTTIFLRNWKNHKILIAFLK